jgi:hypothetical protein
MGMLKSMKKRSSSFGKRKRTVRRTRRNRFGEMTPMDYKQWEKQQGGQYAHKGFFSNPTGSAISPFARIGLAESNSDFNKNQDKRKQDDWNSYLKKIADINKKEKEDAAKLERQKLEAAAKIEKDKHDREQKALEAEAKRKQQDFDRQMKLLAAQAKITPAAAAAFGKRRRKNKMYMY